MARKKLITIGGLPGSGKSTVRNLIASTLGYTTFSTGDFMRGLATTRGMTLEDLNKESARDKEIDLLIDGNMMEIEREKDKMVVDSILGYHFVPSAFHVFLDIPLAVAATRIFGDKAAATRIQSGDIYTTAEEAREHIERRIQNHKTRYQEHYGLNPYNRAQYDLVIDTSHLTPEQVAKEILEAYQKWQQK